MKPIAEYELLDHGIEHSQYFQGCGTFYTDFDDIATGCGVNALEAIDDAIDLLAQMGWETDGFNERMLADEKRKSWPQRPRAKHDEHYYYVSIRVK